MQFHVNGFDTCSHLLNLIFQTNDNYEVSSHEVVADIETYSYI